MSHETVRVALAGRGYDILIGGGLIDRAGALIAPALPSKRAVIVTDETVASLHLPRLEAALDREAIRHDRLVVPAGEGSKSWACLGDLHDRLLGLTIERSVTVIALGGGVVGDLAGFAAASALRGLPLIQIPTTLLAQVDSAVGGKTGINSRHGKNLIGAFHQPRLVLADIDLLDSLPRRQLLAGYAEVVKYGAIDRPDFFAWLEENGARALDGDKAALIHAVRESCRAKAETVAADETEQGRRALLNLGHTFGHALEAETGYGDALLHGEAVALGMVLAFDLSARLGLCPRSDADRLRRHLASVGLPVALPGIGGKPWDAGALLAHMSKDKKVQEGTVTFILAHGIGRSFIDRSVDPAEVAMLLNDAVAA
ncbi:3-dehydroquinate synthase [Inquilinus sp. CAU 1745]|uniref:3-dehydroquinate synthase n=1 Tax=Inquilinus sp. CAU 1745 TaxID=3140369 RepID=UPI00325B6D7F